MRLFYSKMIQGDRVILPEDESWHCAKVLRLEPGDKFSVTDGLGNLYRCEMENPHPKKCVGKIVKTEKEPKKNWNLHIAIAPTKNMDRFEWFIEKTTEIGVDTITPMFTEHSERKKVRADRINKVMLSAMKQSLKSTLPVLNKDVYFRDLIIGRKEAQKYIAYCETGKEEELIFKYKKGGDVIILIGPEGDFSPEEVEAAKKAGFIPISLGKSRLRTETAGIVACHTINLLNELGK